MKTSRDLIQQSVKGLSPMPRVLGVSGSPRKGGNSYVILKQILTGAQQAGRTCDIIELKDYGFQGCIGCEQCRKNKICTGLNDGMTLLYPSILESRGLVLVCPTHNYNVTAWMKAFIDRMYCFYDFQNDRPRSWSSRLCGQGRKAVIAAICEQESKKDMGMTLDAMRLPLEALGYEIVAELPVLAVFDKAKVREQKVTLEKATQLGVELAGQLA
ncbi:MAG: flavodoxin family protein [Desulfobacterales bacterium]|nr:flavodoxin family protein [Desulfobacterales bacterium]MDD4073017.1 flavodoxin family protein [Desulfobacterales bacterium]MDD4391497.1 flavodoxin family protein [Desulfobacterales bacterium]